MEKIKKIAKYATNVLAIINALLIGITPIWGYNADRITNTIAVIIAVIGTYLLGNKIVSPKKTEIEAHEAGEITEEIEVEE